MFSPHGEKAVVVFDDHDIPGRLGVNDFVDDVNVCDRSLPQPRPEPTDVRTVLLTEPADFLPQFTHSGLFVGALHYLPTLC